MLAGCDIDAQVEAVVSLCIWPTFIHPFEPFLGCFGVVGQLLVEALELVQAGASLGRQHMRRFLSFRWRVVRVDLAWQHLVQRNQVAMIPAHVSLLQTSSLHLRQIFWVDQAVLVVGHGPMNPRQLLVVHLALGAIVDSDLSNLVLRRPQVVEDVLDIRIR